MQCKYCQKEITEKPYIVGPKKIELTFCDTKCYLLNLIKIMPMNTIENCLREEYPECVEEINKLIRQRDGIKRLYQPRLF